jgi:hypothetical protein
MIQIEHNLNVLYDDKFLIDSEDKKKEEEEIICKETNVFLNKIHSKKGKKDFFHSKTLTNSQEKIKKFSRM